MKQWKPANNQPIGPSEPLGRRLFDEPMLIGARDQANFGGLLLSHFEEKQGLDFSVDRMGRTNVEEPVVAYLMPRGIHAGKKFSKPKAFNGWMILKAKDLLNPPKGEGFTSQPSPERLAGLDENIYHAHLNLPENADKHATALQLRFLFGKYGRHIAGASNEQVARPSKFLWSLYSVWDKLTGLFRA